ncbi:hypothetical protein [Pseudomonas asiatica]|uniref:hypothetical protein n=1 Tax=Pseudomonas asiatica TaxID=2219225 RepID=UPI00399B6B81
MHKVSAIKIVALAFSFLTALSGYASPDLVDPKSSGTVISEIGSSSEEWRKTISLLTREPLWKARDAYDASHVLMTPMHFAFAVGDTKGVKEFEYLMDRFARQELPGGQLNQAQWMYFVTRYLALRVEFNYPLNAVDSYLAQRTSNWLHNRWLYEPSYQWGEIPLTGIKSKITFIQKKSEWPLSYYPAITDYELFLFSAASDLRFIYEKQQEKILIDPQVKESIKEMQSAGITTILERGTFTSDGGWLFQPGVWRDHPDFRFAGHTDLKTNLEEKRVPNISEDSSHSHRWPLFFRSMIAASDSKDKNRKLLLKAYEGFSNQFTQKVVIVENGSILLKNYMDGSNGIYRYKYATIGSNDNLGYGPSSLSGILGLSWYPFGSNVSGIYKIYENSYPLKENILRLYVGPNTTREVNPLFSWPSFFTNGFAELIAKQGTYISLHYQQDKN